MKLPRISILTVSMNDVIGLSRTIESVINQNYENFQFVVIDGDSNDGSLDLLEKKNFSIDVCISEPDVGIYHAMNKAIIFADGEWLLFMNAGDFFTDTNALSKAVECMSDGVDVIFSDWFYHESGVRIKASKEKMNVRHQSVIYRKSLHNIFGTYVVGKNVTISDFIFFMSLYEKNWEFCNTPLSICEQKGVSANPSHFYQRIAVEFIFGYRNRFYSAFILILYPVYRILKRIAIKIIC